MPRVVVACVASAVLVLAGCGQGSAPIPEPAVQPSLIVGIDANTLGSGVDRAQDEVQRLGLREIREGLRWDDVEPQRGRYDTRAFDTMLARAAARGITVLPLLLGTPKWLSAQPTALPPADAWARFVAFAVRRYGPGGTFWRARPWLDARLAPRWFELWNEPYFKAFSASGIDPVRFAAMQVAAVTAGRAANPDVRYLMPGETTYTADDGSTRDWIEDLYAARPDIGSYADAIATHPYSSAPPGDTSGPRRYQVLRLDDLIATLDAHGDGALPIWITEVGWSTCTSRPQCVSEHDQASDLSEMFSLVAQRWPRRVRALFTFGLYDYDGLHSPDQQTSFGLVRSDGTRKPAWYVVRRAAAAAR